MDSDIGNLPQLNNYDSTFFVHHLASDDCLYEPVKAKFLNNYMFGDVIGEGKQKVACAY